MAEVQLGLGAVVDIATGSELQQTRDSILERLGDTCKADPRYPTGAVLIPSVVPTVATIDIGFPRLGKLWLLKSLTLLGPTATVSGALVWGTNTDAANTPMQCILPALPVPSYNPVHNLIIRDAQHLYVFLSGTGLAASQRYDATAFVLEAEDNPYVVASL